MSNLDNCRKCELKMSNNIETFKMYTSEHARYTSLIFTVVYATYFTGLHMIYTSLPTSVLLCSLVFISISMIPFVINEISIMRLGNKYITKERANWENFFRDPNKDLFKLEEYNYNDRQKIYKIYYKWHPVTFGTSIIFGILSVLYLLIYFLIKKFMVIKILFILIFLF